MALGRKRLVLDHQSRLLAAFGEAIPPPHPELATSGNLQQIWEELIAPCMISEDGRGSFLEGNEADPSNGRPHSVYT